MFKLFFKVFSGLFVLIILAVIFFLYVYPEMSNKDETKSKETVTVKKVVDGDTFTLTNGEKVRLLGIDTPEKYQSQKLEKDVEISGQTKETTKKLGKLASEYTKKLIDGKKVILEREPNYDDRDKYGRLLRYVYLEDGTFVNLKIVCDGYATPYEKYPVSKLDEFRKCYREARENKRGLWGEVEGLEQFDK